MTMGVLAFKSVQNFSGNRPLNQAQDPVLLHQLRVHEADPGHSSTTNHAGKKMKKYK